MIMGGLCQLTGCAGGVLVIRWRSIRHSDGGQSSPSESGGHSWLVAVRGHSWPVVVRESWCWWWAFAIVGGELVSPFLLGSWHHGHHSLKVGVDVAHLDWPLAYHMSLLLVAPLAYNPIKYDGVLQ